MEYGCRQTRGSPRGDPEDFRLARGDHRNQDGPGNIRALRSYRPRGDGPNGAREGRAHPTRKIGGAMKKLYLMSEPEKAEMLKITGMPVILLPGGLTLYDHQYYANLFWQKLAKLHGFLWHTVEAAPGEDPCAFLAEPIKENKNERD